MGMETSRQITRRYFHTVLRRFRHEASLTQEQMAERMGVSVGFFGMMEVGRRWPNIDMLFRIAEALGVRPGELIAALEEEARQR
jgi:transcriptional regulator with XRE-family HTH domain